MKIYFYRTNNKINNKFYYGTHKENSSKYLGSGVMLNRAIRKYGKENFEHIILKEFNTREEAFAFEDRFLKLYKISSLKESYNIKDEGIGGDTFTNNPRKEEIRALKSKAQNKRFEDPEARAKCNVFKNISEERREGLSKIWSKASTGRLNGRSKKVWYKDRMFHTIDEMAEALGISREQAKYRLKLPKFMDYCYGLSCDG